MTTARGNRPVTFALATLCCQEPTPRDLEILTLSCLMELSKVMIGLCHPVISHGLGRTNRSWQQNVTLSPLAKIQESLNSLV